MMLMLVAFAACSDDDEKKESEQSIQKESLLGKWVMSKYVYIEDGETESEEFPTSEEFDVLVYNSDGTCRNYAWMSTGEYDYDHTDRWTLEGNLLTTPCLGDSADTWTVVQFNGKTMTIEVSFEGDSESITYTKVQ